MMHNALVRPSNCLLVEIHHTWVRFPSTHHHQQHIRCHSMDRDLLLAMQLQAEEHRLATLRLPQQQPHVQHPLMQQIAASLQTVSRYDDPLLQAMALSVIPIDALQVRARDALELQQQLGDVGDQHTLHVEDVLAAELTAWFKRDFFSWVDTPPCQWCGTHNTRGVGAAPPTPEEAQGAASRVELYGCTTCGRHTRFPRYNDPGTLLQTRRGRCGEWANCFTLCCIAAGLTVRYCLDTTDHVWTEYWSHGQQRWVHMDPCEGVVDTPLLYEHGWGKQLQYVIGIAQDGIADITRRYTTLTPTQLTSRQASTLPSNILQQHLAAWTAQLRGGLSVEQRALLEARDLQEQKELQRGGTRTTQGGLPGRTTGSVEWRTQRGELGRKGGPLDTPHPALLPPGTRYTRHTLSTDPPPHLDTNHLLTHGAIRASGENPPSETAACAFDNNHNTKWLDFQGASPGGAWLEYRLLTHTPAVQITQYTMTSANDSPERDPCSWVLEGRRVAAGDMAGGDPWVVLHEQEGYLFPKRHETHRWEVHGAPPCRQFRLRVHRVRDAKHANCVQLACWNLYGREVTHEKGRDGKGECERGKQAVLVQLVVEEGVDDGGHVRVQLDA